MGTWVVTMLKAKREPIATEFTKFSMLPPRQPINSFLDRYDVDSSLIISQKQKLLPVAT